MTGNASAATDARAVVDVGGQHHVVVGAGSGLGRAIAHRLAGLGAEVVCMDIDEDAARDTAEQLPSDRHSRSYAIDVRDDESVRTTFEQAIADAGRLHAVVNCAGITGTTGIKTHEVDPADFDNVYAVNLRGALLISRHVVPHMVEHGYGRLLHIASISGKEGNAGMAAYSSTKAGLIGLVKVLGKEYAQTGVTINALAPAVVLTPMVDALPQSQVDYMLDKIPMRRCGTLDEVADAVAWAVSPACSFTTGFTFDLSGGRATY